MGASTERFAFDDAGAPIFLEVDGSPSARRSAIGPIRWMAPEASWEPDYSIFLGGDAIENTSLGMTVSRHRGHVTVLKAPGGGGGHVTVLKIAAGGGGGGPSRATDHNSSRSNKTSNIAILVGGGNGGPTKATDHNSSRSNKTSNISVGGGNGGPTKASDYNSSRSNRTTS